MPPGSLLRGVFLVTWQDDPPYSRRKTREFHDLVKAEEFAATKYGKTWSAQLWQLVF